jgi:hypothetical protein
MLPLVMTLSRILNINSHGYLRMVILVTLCWPSVSFAATYHVSKLGNDSGTCSSLAPCLTIGRAASLAAQPGDVIQVMGGVYEERLTLIKSGSATGGKIILRGHSGAGCPASPTTDRNSRGARPAPSVTVRGIDIRASFVSVECLKIVGNTSNAKLIYVYPALSNIEIIDNYLDGAGLARVGIDVANGVEPAVLPQSVLVARNYLTGAGFGMWVTAKDSLVELNELERMWAVVPADNDYFRFWGDNVAFRKNYLHGNRTEDCPDCHVDCFQTFDLYGNPNALSRNITIDRNVCFHSHQSIIAQNRLGTADAHAALVITNNLFAYPREGGSEGHPWCVLVEGYPHVTMMHNTCIGGSTVLRDDVVAGTFYVSNNIFVGSGYGAQDGNVAIGGSNIIFGTSLLPANFLGDLVGVDPLFMNPENHDYRLRAGSPAIDAGKTVGVLEDLRGQLRPQGTRPDIGAYERSAEDAGAVVAPPQNLQVQSIQ